MSDMSLAEKVRAYVSIIPGASVRAIAVALGETPAAVQNVCWAEGLQVRGLPDAGAILEPPVEHGTTTMFEVMRLHSTQLRRRPPSSVVITVLCHTEPSSQTTISSSPLSSIEATGRRFVSLMRASAAARRRAGPPPVSSAAVNRQNQPCGNYDHSHREQPPPASIPHPPASAPSRQVPRLSRAARRALRYAASA